MSDPETTTTSKRDPRALSTEYHKAHKQLMLWSAILFIWELVGIDLSKAKDAGGNVGPVVTALKSPQAVPWALMGLVIYFLFKCSTEWAQCNVNRRKLRFARSDFVSAWIVAVAAIALYVGQAISRVQLANAVQNPRSRLISLIMGAFVAQGLLGTLGAVYRRLGIPANNIDIIFPSVTALECLLGFGGLIFLPRDWRFALTGIAIGGVVTVASQTRTMRDMFRNVIMPKK